MCSKCGNTISVSWSMTVNELMDYARENRGSPAAANGRLDTAIEVLRNNGGCSSCIGEIESLKASIY